MADYVNSLLCVTGPPADIQEFCLKHLAGGTLDFNTVIPMPAGLEIESSSAVETGYAALHGDWASVAGYWMFKEPAKEFGYPFPLAAREQVIHCLKSFESADMYLVPAEQYHRNQLAHGHGDWYGWCMEHWGTKWNADEVKMTCGPENAEIRFVTAGAYPKPIFKKLSRDFPALDFHVRHVDEHLRRGGDLVFKNGKETRKIKRLARDLASEILVVNAGAGPAPGP